MNKLLSIIRSIFKTVVNHNKNFPSYPFFKQFLFFVIGLSLVELLYAIFFKSKNLSVLEYVVFILMSAFLATLIVKIIVHTVKRSL